LVSVLGDDYPAAVLETLQRRGVDLGGVHRLHGPGVRTWVLYEGDVRRLIHRLRCPTHEEVSPEPARIPTEWHTAPAFHLAPMPFAVQRALLESIRERSESFISIDPHRPVTEETLADWKKVLADADAFFPGEDELLLDGVHTDPQAALPRLVIGRLRFVVFKRGPKGGMLYDAHAARYYTWTARAEGVIDQTGAGDTFSIGFVLAHLEGRSIEACLQRAVVAASLAIQDWGPAGLLGATRADAEARLRQWYGGEVT
jgi:sugar/nucleoside kinase (ribokinase family)